jgi:hypothetical protein
MIGWHDIRRVGAQPDPHIHGASVTTGLCQRPPGSVSDHRATSVTARHHPQPLGTVCDLVAPSATSWHRPRPLGTVRTTKILHDYYDSQQGLLARSRRALISGITEGS